jgi:hypothetical protein
VAGRVSTHNTIMMTRLAYLRPATSDLLTVAYVRDLLALAPHHLIGRSGLVSDPGASPPVRRDGILYAAGGLLRVVGVPTAATMPTLAVYAVFDGLEETPVLLAKAVPSETAAEAGATILELRDPPGDCRLAVLASARADIYYSHTV